MSRAMTAADLAHDLKAKRSGSGWIARCPAHDDHRESLSIGEGENGRLLLKCHAGCTFDAIMSAAGVEPTKPNGEDRGKRRIVATYDYHDARGDLVFQVVRYAPKDFRQRRPDGNGGWIWGRGETPSLPYRLPAVLNANEIYICEGEKDCDNLARHGIVATTNPGGADPDSEGGSKWSAGFGRYFDGRHVILIPDNDGPGRRHVQAVARKLVDHAASIKVLDLPALPPKGDVSDWLAAGGTAEQLAEIAAAAPYWAPEDTFIQDVERQARTAPTLPVIDIVPGKLSERTAAAIAALRAARLDIFDRGGQLVRPVRVADPETLGGVRRPVGALVLRPVEPEWLRLRLAELATWRKWDNRADKWRAADPPHDVPRTLTAAPDEGAWPYLRAVVRHPVLLPDGRRLTDPGYDASTGLLIDAPGKWPPLADRPTRDHAVEARARLEHLLRFYPWVSDVDRAVALSLILTALARAVLPAAPGHGTDAPAPGTGKSLLIDAAAILSTGTTAAVMDYGRDRDEATKRLDGMLLAGDAVISIDNIEASIEGAALCQTLTQATRRIRPLGASAMVTVPCTALLTMNGNNLTLKGDIVRRILVCRLDAGCERPELREIPQDLLADVRRQRGDLVRHAQTIMAAYIAAGCPKQNLPPLGGYREWSAMVRDALVWSGAEDPVAAMERTRADDPSRQAIDVVLSAWHAAFSTDPTTAAEAIARADPDPELRKAGAEPDQRLREALEMVAVRGNKIEVRTLGHWLRVNRDVRAGALILRRYAVGGQGGAVRWQVVK